MADAALTIARATLDEAPAIHALLVEAGRDLAARGFHNWSEPYPFDRLCEDIDTREVWSVRREAAVIATYTLASSPPRPYEPSPWPDDLAPAIYLNRLAVDPRQSHGIGSICLDVISARARSLGATVLRCDVFASNAAVRRFYERRGFVEHGTRSHARWTYVCYEWVLPGAPT